MSAPGHHAAGEPPGLAALLARLERVGLGADGRDLDAVGEAFRQSIAPRSYAAHGGD